MIENNTQVLRLFKTLLLEGKWTEEIVENSYTYVYSELFNNRIPAKLNRRLNKSSKIPKHGHHNSKQYMVGF